MLILLFINLSYHKKAMCYFETKRSFVMITKSIKYPYAKLTFDVLGILSSITF